MASYNKVLLMGNLCADPETRYTPKGTALTEVRIACNEKWNDDNGNTQERTTFVSATFWGKRAETVQRYFKKGDPIFIEGKLRMDSWEKNGEKRTALKVTADNFTFVSSGNSRSEPAPAPDDAPNDNIPY